MTLLLPHIAQMGCRGGGCCPWDGVGSPLGKVAELFSGVIATGPGIVLGDCAEAYSGPRIQAIADLAEGLANDSSVPFNKHSGNFQSSYLYS